MQFHRDGFRPGNPDAARRGAAHHDDVLDVLVVGAGPAGLVVGAQLAAFPDINYAIVERRDTPLELGQADGVACRTVEMFDAFGLSAPLTREAYWVNETAFWGPAQSGGITRTGCVADVEEGVSEFPHVIVNQARLQDMLIEKMSRAARGVAPEYGQTFVDLDIPDDPSEPVHVVLEDRFGARRVCRARYVVGADGARSAVRRSLGLALRGDAQNKAWGVLDVLAETNFPDIRRKCVIQSGEAGNVGVIPREGGYLVRLYVDLGEVPHGDTQLNERVSTEDVVEVAKRVFQPYTFDIKQIAWSSVYQVGQRLTDRFDDVENDQRDRRSPRVFIAGDACHTHSAKAGQGMNVSMQDGFNLGWKLGAVLSGQARPDLLNTYSAERQPVAQQLIDFDRRFSAIIGGRAKDPNDPDDTGLDPAEVQRAFTQAGRFTAGVGTCYPQSQLVGAGDHQRLAAGFPVGMRFHSAPVTRLADAKPVHLGHVHRADGRWRFYIFGEAGGHLPNSRMWELCEFLENSDDSPLNVFGRGGDVDSVFDVRGVFAPGAHAFTIEDVHPLLRPKVGGLKLKDYEKAFVADHQSGADIYEMRQIDPQRGALVVVRPDQYVSQVLPLGVRAELTEFFAGFMGVRTNQKAV